MRLLLLGPLVLLDARGDPVAVSGSKRRAVLAALALRGTVSTDRLVAELWGNTPPADAANALQAHITRLRRALAAAGGPDRLVTGSSHYTLVLRQGERDTVDFTSTVDSAREAADPVPSLRSALALWRGPALSGCVLGDICAAEADALDERRLAALELLYDASLRAGRHREVVGELARSTAAHPLRERFYEQLIVALCRCGRRADAVEVYDRARRRLRAELDVAPGPGLRRVVAALP
jgi:DNA-binding SARP family transcriptional activator